MKKLNNLIYIGFALIVWGSFANFAQNDYGYVMIHWTWFVLSIILLAEAVINLIHITSLGAARALYLFSEHFLIAIFFLAGFFKFRHFPGAGLLYAVSCVFLGLLYIISAFIRLAKDLKHGRALPSWFSWFTCQLRLRLRRWCSRSCTGLFPPYLVYPAWYCVP